MIKTIALVSVAVMCASVAHAQPTSCNDDAQCHAGYFCETAVNLCHKCLHCEDLKREAPILSATSCIKSVVECGSCLQGLGVDHNRADVNGECVPLNESSAESSLPVYIWSIIGLLILGVLIAMVIIIIYVLRRKDLFRVSTATWLRSSCTSTNINASAPEPPPPYNPYTAVRAESPFNMPDVAYSPPSEEEPSHPFIKRAPGSNSQSAREAAGSQNARVFAPPAYVRIDPQTPISPLSEAEDSNQWPSIHNEDTTPHDWTPNTSTNDTNGNISITEVTENPESTTSGAISSDLPALLAAARDTTLVAPPAKKLKTQDNNNNGSRGAASNDSGDSGVGRSTTNATEAPSIYFNIVQINNTKL